MKGPFEPNLDQIAKKALLLLTPSYVDQTLVLQCVASVMRVTENLKFSGGGGGGGCSFDNNSYTPLHLLRNKFTYTQHWWLMKYFISIIENQLVLINSCRYIGD